MHTTPFLHPETTRKNAASSNEKLVIGGSMISPLFIRKAIELSGISSPRIVIDSSARVKPEGLPNSAKAFDGLFDHMKLPLPDYVEIESPERSRNQKEDLIRSADILLVLGGSTLRIYTRWIESGMCDIIQGRARSGEMVAAGASAGAMIWFDGGYSDSLQEEVQKGDSWNYIKSPGFGIIPSLVTAHHADTDEHERRRDIGFRNFLQNSEQDTGWSSAIGLNSDAALVCNDGVAEVMDIKREAPSYSDLPPAIVHRYDNKNSYIDYQQLYDGDVFTYRSSSKS